MKALLSKDMFEKLKKYIYTHLGLHFPENKKYLLENCLQIRLNAVGCESFEDYYQFLQFDQRHEQELIELTNSVTTNETFFFRDHVQIDCLRSHLLPEIISRRERQKSLRLWSAGCSSGEEPYTLAMLLEEDFPNLSSWRIEILATDISRDILAKAKAGRYSNYSVRNISEELLKKYFIFADGQYEVQATLRKRVKFSTVNLFDQNHMRSIRDVDLVLCRNVLIYFDEQARRQIVSGFYDALREQGTLMIGFSESLHDMNQLFHAIPWKRTNIYSKEGSHRACSVTGHTPSKVDIPQPVGAGLSYRRPKAT